MDTNKKNREYISAFCDGELPSDDAELATAALRSPEGAAAWQLFFQIGDVLRAGGTPPLSPEFAARLAARLAQEPLPVRRAAPAPDPELAQPVLSEPRA